MKKIIVTIIVFLISTLCFADYSEIPYEVRGSLNSPVEHPAFYVQDKDDSTNWSLGEGEEGWLEFNMNSELNPVALVIKGYLSKSSYIFIEYNENGLWKPFANGYLNTISDGARIVPFYYEDIVTSSMRIHLYQKDEFSHIAEVTILGKEISNYKLPVRKIITSEKEPNAYPADFILDNNTYTRWSSEFQGAYYPYYDLWNKEKAAFHHLKEEVNLNNTEIIFELDQISHVNILKLYIDQDSRGSVEFYYEENGSWTSFAMLSELDWNYGWNEIQYSGINTKKIKLQAYSQSSMPVYIGEIEFWGKGKYIGDEAVILHSYPAKEKNIFNYSFKTRPAIWEKLYLEISLPSSNQSKEQIQINGFELIDVDIILYEDSTLFRYSIPYIYLNNELNFLKIDQLEKPPLFVRLMRENRSGLIPFAEKRSFEIKEPYSKKEFSFNGNVDIHEVILNHPDYIKSKIEVFTNGFWVSLKEVQSEKLESIYKETITASAIRIYVEESMGNLVLKVRGSLEKVGPTVKFLWPKKRTAFEEYSIPLNTITGIVDDPHADVNINGKTTGRFSHFFWADIYQFWKYDNDPYTLLDAVALDSNGLSDHTSIDIYMPYTIFFELDQGDDIIYTNEDFVTLSGRMKWFSAQEGFEMTINNEPVLLDGILFTTKVFVEKGFNLLEITCKNRYGKIQKMFRRVFRNPIGLSLFIDTPENGSIVNSREITIQGRAFGSGDLSLTVNNKNAEIIGNQFSVFLRELTEGKNTFQCVLSDKTGKIITKTISLIFDMTAPVIKSIIPANGDYVTSLQVPISVNVDDPNDVWVLAEGNACSFSGGTFSTALQYKEGESTVHIYAVDGAGNYAEDYHTFTVDVSPPLPFEVFKNPSGWTNQYPVIFFYTMDRISGIDKYNLSINGECFEDINNFYQIDYIEDGVYPIIVEAIDKAGLSRISKTTIYIDTTPPDRVSNFRTIPNENSIKLSWETKDEDVIHYVIERTPQFSGGPVTVVEQNYVDTEISYGETYYYTINAIDRANNESGACEPVRCRGGLEDEIYNPEDITIVEYEGLSLFIPQNSLPEGTVKVLAFPIESEELESASTTAFVSPVFEFVTIGNDDQITSNNNTFSASYVGIIQYDETLIPRDFPEENLGVYRFDPIWGRWTLLEHSNINVEDNTAVFTSNHFSIYSVQATSVQDFTSSQISETQFTPFSENSSHGDVTVHPSSGAVSSSVTDIILPGPGGFDLAIKRLYNSFNAQYDARLYGHQKDIDEDSETTNKPSDTIADDEPIPEYKDWVLPFLNNQGDMAYSFGNGWRLNLPYVRDGSKNMMISLPTGANVSFWSMNLTRHHEKDNNYTIRLENHDNTDFTLDVKMIYKKVSIRYGDKKKETYKLDTWNPTEYILTLRDGTVYKLDDHGRTTKIINPTGLVSISVMYCLENPEISNSRVLPKIDYMAIDYKKSSDIQKIKFEYDDTTIYPVIRKVYIENDRYNRSVEYSRDTSGNLINVLNNGTTPGTTSENVSKEWIYHYGVTKLDSCAGPPSVNIQEAIQSIGREELYNRTKDLQNAIYQFRTYHLNGMEGPGTGYIRLKYTPRYLYKEILAGKNRKAVSLVASEAAVYPTRKALDEDNPQKRTSYYYNFVDKKDSTKEWVSYNNLTEVSDGHLKTEIFYEMVEKKLYKWQINKNEDITERVKDQETVVYSRINKTVRSDYLSGELFETITNSYRRGSTDFYPISQKYTRGEKSGRQPYVKTDFSYDVWHNEVKRNVEEGVWDPIAKDFRMRKFTINRVFLNTSLDNEIWDFDWSYPWPYPWKVCIRFIGFSWSDPWKPFHESTLRLTNSKSINNRNNLILAERIENYTPIIESGAITPKITPADNQYVYYEYDELGRVTGKAIYNSSDSQWDVEHNTYYSENKYGLLKKSINAEGDEVDYNYIPSKGYLKTQSIRTVELEEDAEKVDLTTIYSYDHDLGTINSITYPGGNKKNIYYDPFARPIKIEIDDEDENGIPRLISSSAIYNDELDNLFHISIDEDGNRTKYFYNTLGQAVKVDKESAITKISYNWLGKKSEIIAPEGNIPGADEWRHKTIITYNSMGRESKIIYPDDSEFIGNNPVTLVGFDYNTNILSIFENLTNTASIDSEGIHKTDYLLDMGDNRITKTSFVGNEKISSSIYYDGLGNQVATLNPKGGLTRHTYNSRNKRTRTVLPGTYFFENNIERFVNPEINYTYDKTGRLLFSQSMNSKDEVIITKYNYNEVNWLLSKTDLFKENPEEGKLSNITTSKIYDKNGNVIAEIDPDGNKTFYEYTISNRMKKMTERGNRVTTQTYYPSGLLRTVTDPRGNSGNYSDQLFTIKYAYDKSGNIDYIDSPSVTDNTILSRVDFTYDKNSNLTRLTEQNGSSRSFIYDSRNQVIRMILLDSETNKTYIESYQYDLAGNKIRIIDFRGNSTKNIYDELNRLITVRYPEGNEEHFRYDETDNIVSHIDGKNNITTYKYDKYDRIGFQWNPDSQLPLKNEYDRFGNLTRQIDEKGTIRTYEYDNLHRLVQEKNGEGFNKTFKYDRAGYLRSSIDYNGIISTYTYNDSGFVKTINRTDGISVEKTEYLYDEVGFIMEVDDNGVLSRFNGYDGTAGSYNPDFLGKVTTQNDYVDGEVLSVSYGYDAAQRVNYLDYPDGNPVSYNYSQFGELISVDDFINGIPVYENGLLKELTSGNNITNSFDYDKNGRLTTINYSSLSETIKEYNFTYDNANNITALNSNRYSYDERNRLTEAFLQGEFTIVNPETDTILGMAMGDYSGSRPLNRDIRDEVHNFKPFIEEDSVTEIEDINIIEFDFAATSIGIDLGEKYEVTSMLLSSIQQESRIVEEDINIYVSDDNSGGSYNKISSSDFSVSKILGNRNLEYEIRFKYPLSTRYIKLNSEFDDRSRGFKFVNKSTFQGTAKEIIRVFYSIESRTESYQYDKMGNRVNIDLKLGNNSSRSSYYYENTNRLAIDGEMAFQYDKNGNLIKKGTHVIYNGNNRAVNKLDDTVWAGIANSLFGVQIADTGDVWEYNYDFKNRLVSVLRNHILISSYKYNGSNLRVKKEKYGRTENEVIYFSFDQEGKLLYERKENSFTRYIYLLGTLFALEDGMITMTGNLENHIITERTYLHTDQIGSVIAATNSEGQPIWNNDYTPFGEQAILDQSRFALFSGKQYDYDIGLTYFNARWYDPSTGRFITEDQKHDGDNWYTYCNNNPGIYIDSSGEFAFVPVLIGVGIGMIVGGVIGHTVAEQKGIDMWSSEWLAHVGVGAIIGGIAGGLGDWAGSIGLGAAIAPEAAFFAGMIDASLAGAVGGFFSGFGNSLAFGGEGKELFTGDGAEALKMGGISAIYGAVTAATLYAARSFIPQIVGSIKIPGSDYPLKNLWKVCKDYLTNTKLGDALFNIGAYIKDYYITHQSVMVHSNIISLTNAALMIAPEKIGENGPVIPLGRELDYKKTDGRRIGFGLFSVGFLLKPIVWNEETREKLDQYTWPPKEGTISEL